jgi:protease II
MSIAAPVAKRIPFIHKYHGREFPDPYHWLKDQSPKEKKPEIIEYIKVFIFDKGGKRFYRAILESLERAVRQNLRGNSFSNK